MLTDEVLLRAKFILTQWLPKDNLSTMHIFIVLCLIMFSKYYISIKTLYINGFIIIVKNIFLTYFMEHDCWSKVKIFVYEIKKNKYLNFILTSIYI